MRQALAVDVTGLLDEVARLKQRVDALERAHRPRDEADRVLRRTLAVATHGLPFTASQLLTHALEAPALARALREALIQTSLEAGAWLRDARGMVDGIAIARGRGRKWTCLDVETLAIDRSDR